MNATVNDIIKIMEELAPSYLAEEWDNSGLQVGQKDWPVKKILISLDPSINAVKDACSQGINLLITHHPLIFQPLKSIQFNSTIGQSIFLAAKHQLAIFCAHTNLDSIFGGINDILSEIIGLNNIKVLKNIKTNEQFKLVVYVPYDYEQKILDAIFERKIGKIGEYKCCTFRNPGTGTFQPGSSAKPFIGKQGEISHANEIRIEVVVSLNEIKSTIEAIKKVHPYETMAYDIYSLYQLEKKDGLGRVGEIDQKTDLVSFANKIKDKMNLPYVKIAGNKNLIIEKVAICSGSGSGLMKDFFSCGAQVYVSGDFRYHDARAAEDADLGLIDIGHFNSEYIIVDAVLKKLKSKIYDLGFDIDVLAYKLERDPFKMI